MTPLTAERHAGLTGPAVGTLAALWRYPVKSMMGQEINAARLTDRGLLGDRAFALIDAVTGKIASAKNPAKWPNLFDFRAEYATPPESTDRLPPVRVTLPGGAAVSTDPARRDAELSAAVGRPVHFLASVPASGTLEEYWPDMDGLAHRDAVTDEAVPEGTFFDLSVLHVLTTATLDHFRTLYPKGRFETRRFRPNLVVATPGEGFVENDWVGRTVAIGSEVRLSITGPCPRCVMTTLAQGDLPRDPGILRTAALHNDVKVGVYASVLRAGVVRRGDVVAVL